MGLSSEPGRPKRNVGLGELLISRGVLTKDELEGALARQRETSQRLATVLVDEGFVDELDLVRTLAEHFEIEFVDLDERVVDPSAAVLVKESFARYHQLLPVGVDEEGRVLVAMVNPTNVFSLDDVRSMTGREVLPLMAERRQLVRAIDRAWGAGDAGRAILRIEEDADDGDVEATRSGSEQAPVVEFVNHLIARAVAERASDIHLDPGEEEMRIRFRIDGVLHPVLAVPRTAQPTIVSRIKIMAEIDIAERRVPQDGRIALVVDERPVSLRVVTLPTAYGEAVVIRVLEESAGVRSLEELGMSLPNRAVYEKAFRSPWGAIVVTGPTGSGKSTTMHATVAELNDPSRNIVTVEDPIEYRLPGVKQIQVNRKAGLTFASALRAILRSDPDVVLVGEMRDAETAKIAAEAALTGHLVITSLHTNDAASTPIRLLDMGIEPFMVTSALNCIVAQRLARRLCERCKAPQDPRHAGFPGLPEWVLDDGDGTYFSAVGCNLCSGTGYFGRIGIHEIMEITDEIDHLIVNHAVTAEIERTAIRHGMVTLREDGLRKAAAGETSIEEVLRAIG